MRALLLTIALLPIGLPIHGQDSRQIRTTHTSPAELLSALDQQGEFGGGGTGVQILDRVDHEHTAWTARSLARTSRPAAGSREVFP